MVDPSGGPYICVGMELNRKFIVGIEPKDDGYLLLLGDVENKWQSILKPRLCEI